jgi:hypothetical protein
MHKPALACLALAMTLLVAAPDAAPAQGLNPKRQTATGTFPRPPVPSTYPVKVLFVRLADDDGSRASTQTKANAQAAIDTANAIYRTAGGDIRFELAPESDFAGHVRNTIMNHDCLLQPGWTEAKIAGQTNQDVNGDGHADWSDYAAMCDGGPPVAARNAYAVARPDRLLVYSRGGSETILWDVTHYVLKYATGGHSGANLFYVAMPVSTGGDTLLAHELGHYFHLPHTFGLSAYAQSMADAYLKINAWLAAHPGEDPLNCFDGDRMDTPAIFDTPSDAGDTLFTESYGNSCDPTHGSVTFVVQAAGGTKNLVLTPDRANVMSYFKHCPWPQHFSTNQTMIMRQSLTMGNRQPLVARDVAERSCYETLHPERERKSDPVGTLRDTLRRVAVCHLLARRTWRWEMVTGIYATPEQATRAMVRDKTDSRLFVDESKERRLLSMLSDARNIVVERER